MGTRQALGSWRQQPKIMFFFRLLSAINSRDQTGVFGSFWRWRLPARGHDRTCLWAPHGVTHIRYAGVAKWEGVIPGRQSVAVGSH